MKKKKLKPHSPAPIAQPDAMPAGYSMTQLISSAGVASRYRVDEETARVWLRKKVIVGHIEGEWRTRMDLLLKAEKRPESHLSKERICETTRDPVSVAEASKEMGVTEKTARLKMAAKKLGFSFKIGRLRYVDRRDFEDYLAVRIGKGIKWH
jgi:hypothetical protein